MSNKQSYLDTLNAGRRRRPRASMNELNRTLDNLESKFQSMSGGAQRPLNDPYAADIARRMENLSNEAARPAYNKRPPEHVSDAQRPFQSLARDFERARKQDESVAAVSKIAAELRDLREEMRHEMTSSLHREFENLRDDIESAYTTAANGSRGTELRGELDRISNAVSDLAQRNDDGGIDQLRDELEDVKRSIGSLAREETLQSVDSHWNEFGRRWDAFEERVSSKPDASEADPAFNALYERLAEISDAVQDLPESLSLRSLEEKIRAISGSLDRFAEEQSRISPHAIGTIEERLDEISRAIVASSVVSQPNAAIDHEALQRIENGMSSLLGQLEILDNDRPAIFEGLAQLSQRMDEIAHRADSPDPAVEHLAAQIDAISNRMENAPQGMDGDAVLKALEGRLYGMAERIDRLQGAANERSKSLFREMESQLTALSQRLDEREADPAAVERTLMEAIDSRFSEFAARLEEGNVGPDREAIDKLERRLESISVQLDTSAQQIAGVDPELIRSLEEQVSGLSSHLAHPAGPMPEFEDIRPRLDSIEESIAGSREGVMEAARQAAETAVRNVTTSEGDTSAVADLAEDLKSLQKLAHQSDERNARTFEAIHDTLLKIVDRLGTLESGGGGNADLVGGDRVEMDPAPSVDPYQSGDEIAPGALDDVSAETRFDGPEVEEVDADGRKSLFSGLSRALKKSPAEADDLAADNEAIMTPDAGPEMDAELNRPLEPGSGAPDLQEIMKRVRKERSQPAKSGDSNASQSDFIAAARRAAQAAAAEAEVLKKKSDNTGEKSGFQAAEFLKLKRKPILMAAAAIMIALAGLQLSKTFISDTPQVASVEPDPAPVVSEPATLMADATSADEPVTLDTAAEDPVRSVDAEPLTLDAPQLAAAQDNVQPMTPDSADAASSGRNDPAGAEVQHVVPPVDAGPVPLREAAASGDPKAMYEIGARYAKGRGVDADLSKAAKWYERSADLGFAPAQYRIGNLSEKGIGVPRDVGKAKTWYQLAAAQGNASAMHNLAVLHAMGAEGTVDNESAARWFLQAAELGIRDSQFNLGILAAKGVGIKQNLSESYKWFALAAKSGDKDAASKRDEVAQALGTEQLARARAAAELWKPKPLSEEANSVEVPPEWTESNDRTASIDMKKAITNIQLILAKNGYDTGRPDGVIGARTKAAIRAFQKDNGMKPTGEVDEKLIHVLLSKK